MLSFRTFRSDTADQADQPANGLNGLGEWLLDHAGDPLTTLHEGLCRELVSGGVPINRSSLGIELLHPEQSGQQSIWTDETSATWKPAFHGVEQSSDYLLSPARIVDERNEPYRRKLDAPVPEMPLLEELRQTGLTDYVIFPLPFLDRTRSAFISFATASPDGFCDRNLPKLETAARMFSPYAERRVLRRIAVDLLDTYVGRHAGERVFHGSIRRGEVETISCAIMMCDLRSFTEMSNRLDRSELIDLLNRSFEALEGPIEAHGGEILKFIGDGVLAIFRVEPGLEVSCRRAFAAAREVSVALASLGHEPEQTDLPVTNVEFAMGLHVGEVAYGNVGGRHRLDFTVLGAAVNYANRLQNLAKTLDQTILISGDFARHIPGSVVELGVHPLRGISDAELIFSPAS